jgi:peptidoglycan/LPS O-acetylase OafA/YrhL
MRHSPNPQPLRARRPYYHRAPDPVGGRRVPPSRDLFPPVAEMDDEDFLVAGWILAMAVIAAVADVVAMFILPALTLPIYTLVVASCVLVIVLAVLAEPEEVEQPVEHQGASGPLPTLYPTRGRSDRMAVERPPSAV